MKTKKQIIQEVKGLLYEAKRAVQNENADFEESHQFAPELPTELDVIFWRIEDLLKKEIPDPASPAG